MKIGDNIFPPGEPPRSCIICGQYEVGKGWRMGGAKASHGGMHVRDGSARLIAGRDRDEYVLTELGLSVAIETSNASRCKRCGLVHPKHAKTCVTGWMERDAKKRERCV
jgi:hypothetical protein